MAIPDGIRKELAELARSKKTRTRDFSKGQPTRWKHYEVENITPSSIFIPYFTEDGAWQFIADQLDSGHEVEEIKLAKPPGTVGYVMRIFAGDGKPKIYIKLQKGNGKVIGRSFHYDDPPNS